MPTVIEDLAQAMADLDQSRQVAAASALAVTELQGQLATAQASIATLTANIDKGVADLAAAQQLLDGEVSAHAATRAELERAQRALANPAFADAAATGSSTAADAGTPPPATEPMTKEQMQAEYIRVRDEQGPKAAAEFRAAHAAELGL